MWKSIIRLVNVRKKTKHKKIAPKAVTAQLEKFLHSSTPELVTVLCDTWGNQSAAITYKEIRKAIEQGYLSDQYIEMWQKSYSQLVVQQLAPQWETAIAAAAKNVTDKYGEFAVDLSWPQTRKWIDEHSAEFVTNVMDEQKQAMRAMIRRAAMTENFTVDELARAIRPTIGLTKQDSERLVTYYENLRADGLTAEQARSAQLKKAEVYHRNRAQTIADFELTSAYNHGNHLAIKQAVADGLIVEQQKKWSTDATESVCDVCGALDGTIIDIDAEFSIPDKFFSKQLPPIHPHCHCCLEYVDKPGAVLPDAPGTTLFEITPQELEGMTAEELEQKYQSAVLAAAPPDPAAAAIPESIKGISLSHSKKMQMGTGEMHLMLGDDGKQWLFKPAQSKSGVYEPFRAYVQEAGYKVQHIIDPTTAVPIGTGEYKIGGKMRFGAYQRRIQSMPGSPDLRKWQSYPFDLPEDVIAQLQRENVVDWLMCNYDSHGGNFLIDMECRVIGVDKEQAFRYIKHAGAKKLSYSFHPNSVYGEKEPIYNTLYRRFAHGELELNLNDTLAAIKRVEAIPDKAYREIFREYAESLHGKGKAAEELLDMIVDRKKNVRKVFEDFYSEILTERKGKKTVFKFADTIAGTAKQTASSAGMSMEALKQMSITDLQKIGQAQKLPMWSKMSKAELMTALNDPSLAEDMAEACRARTKAQRLARQAKKPDPAPPTVPHKSKSLVDGVMTVDEALSDMDAALKDSSVSGVPLVSDSSVIDGLQVNLRRYTIDGETYYEMSGKMTYEAWKKQADAFSRKRYRKVSRQFNPLSRIDYKTGEVDYKNTLSRMADIPVYLDDTGDTLFMLAHQDCAYSARAIMGEFSIRVKAGYGTDAAAKLRNALLKYDLEDVLRETTQADIDRLKTMRLIWQNSPQSAIDLTDMGFPDDKIEVAAQILGITKDRIDAMTVKKISGGYYTFLDPEMEKVMDKIGVAYPWSGVTSADGVVNVIKSGELIASNYRVKRGIFGSGASVSADIRTGGADNVFCRIAMKNNVGKERYSHSFSGGPYRIIIDRKELTRTDWYAYTGDEFGTTDGRTFSGRHTVQRHFRALASSYESSNEVMFRRSVNSESFVEIRCESSNHRISLINALNAAGIHEINGQPLEKFIKVGTKL